VYLVVKVVNHALLVFVMNAWLDSIRTHSLVNVCHVNWYNLLVLSAEIYNPNSYVQNVVKTLLVNRHYSITDNVFLNVNLVSIVIVRQTLVLNVWKIVLNALKLTHAINVSHEWHCQY
jgi:hypothetical protein